MEYDRQLREAKQQGKPSPLPFDKLVMCNIGNPQSLNQQPITFFRQVMAMCEYPALARDPEMSKMFPADAVRRAQSLLKEIPGGTGAYSESQGIRVIRENVARFIEARDGCPATPDNIFLTEGASQGISVMLHMITKTPGQDAIMVPIPQYPLYTATMALVGADLVPYFLDESKNWALDKSELESQLRQAQQRNQTVKALVVINPGNPSGACLSRENIEQVIRFCEANNIVLFADEVYQTNVYNPERPFTSFKKVVSELKSDVELLSFHSVSKGVVGECGKRGGYMEITNIDPTVKAEIYKVFSIGLCSNVVGQIMVDLMVNPPKKGDESYESYTKEVDDLYNSLKRRAAKLAEGLNSMTNVSCTRIEGAMYAFPCIKIPQKAVQAAKEQGRAADVLYALELLKATGVCVVPGSGFGQKDGTYHVRTTFLPPENEMEACIKSFKEFNDGFMAKYA